MRTKEINMGTEVEWKPIECVYLTKAWLEEFGDSILGIDPTSKNFITATHLKISK